MTEVHALSDYGLKDNYNNYKSKNSVSLNKIKCINDNININGVNAGDINSAGNGLATSANSFGNNERYYGEENNNKQSKDYDCVVNNDNENRQVTLLPTEPTPPTPPTPPVNNVCTVWTDNTPGDDDIFFARSTDGGLTFSEPPDNLSENAGFSSQLQISSSTS